MAKRKKDTLVEVENLETGLRAEWNGNTWTSKDEKLANWLNLAIPLAEAKLREFTYIPDRPLDLGMTIAHLAAKKVKITYQPPEITEVPKGVF